MHSTSKFMRSKQSTRQSRRSTRQSQAPKPIHLSPVPSSDLEETYVVIPPDGGWGWLVVVASFICHFFVDGMMYTFGIFLDEISENFNVDVTKVAVANSIMCGFYFVVGPITCALANRFGFRVVGIIGGIIASTAFSLSTIFNNLIAFNIFIGCFCGIGFNMIFMPSLLVVGFYFEKWRALATAMAVCGSSIGVMTFPPVITTLLKRFNWKWKFRLLSGLTGITILCCILYKPIKPVKVTAVRKAVPLLDSDDADSIGTFNLEKEADQLSFNQIYRNTQGNVYPTASDLLASTRRMSDWQSLYFNASNPSIARSVFTNKADAVSVGPYTIYEYDESDSRDNNECCRRCCCCCFDDTIDSAHSTRTSFRTVNGPMYRDDIFYTGSLNMLSVYSKSRATVWSGPSRRSRNSPYSVIRAMTHSDFRRVNRRCPCCPLAVTETLATMMDFRLLKSPSFFLLVISGFFTMLGIYCPFIFVVKRAEEMKIDKEWSTLLITVIGISNTVGRIACGIVSCLPKCDTLVISYVTLFITGGAIIASNYLPNLKGQLTFAILFGFNIASLTVLRSIVTVELVGLENLTNAFGIIALFYGLASFAGVPIAGTLRNFTGQYDASFMFSGCSFLLSALLLVPIRKTAKWEANKKKPKVTFKTNSVSMC